MTMPEWLWLLGTLLIMGIGVVGSVLPAIPGTPLIFAVAVVHRMILGEAGADLWVLIALGVLAIASLVADLVASLLGAKTLGATRRGLLGAGIGGLVGLFFGPVGILVGPFVGALVFELLGGREMAESAKAGVGATLGLFVGAVGKVACAIAMVGLFVGSLLWRSLAAGA